jgi:sec-independent protein translocase protein TatB
VFDVGFPELVLVFIIGLLVLGPQRLPKVAAEIGKWVGRARRTATELRRQLEREIELSDIQPPPTQTRSGPPPAEPEGENPSSRPEAQAAPESAAAAEATPGPEPRDTPPPAAADAATPEPAERTPQS